MNQTRIAIVFLAVILIPSCDWSQETSEGTNLFGGLSAKELDAIRASRTAAQKELAEKSAVFDTPGIADALEAEHWLIAVAKISSVQLPTDADSPTIVTFHVEQRLRGESEVNDFSVESRWNPKKEEPKITLVDGNYHETALDKSEPKAGNRYILGYTLDNGVEKFVFVPGVIDLKDPEQAELIANVRRFLDLEAEARVRGIDSYLDALDDKVPWIRDIAVHRLTYLDTCNASSLCAERFAAAVQRQFRSETPNERGEAIDWLIWVDSISRSQKERGYTDGLPVLSDSTLRALLDKAVQDPNVELGDRAFQARETFDLDRNGSPGDCFAVMPELRKAVLWHSKPNPWPPEDMTGTYGCIPPR